MKNTSKREKEIVQIIKAVKKSEQSPLKYFSRHKLPFSLRQLYSYLKIHEEEGIEGLYDRRKDGNAKKITSEIKHYLFGLIENNRELPASDISSRIKKRFDVNISRDAINKFRKSHRLKRIKKALVYKELPFAALEIISALAYHTGILDSWSDAIEKHIKNIRKSKMFKENRKFGADYPSKRNKGKFTTAYNKLKKIRAMKFDSIDNKVKYKDLSRLQILDVDKKTLIKKNLTLLSLPSITFNGRIRNINRGIGNSIEHISGYNYKHHTIDKYTRELKYLRISSNFIKETSEFWEKFWSKFDAKKTKFLCYYIDGNTKPIWSVKRCKKNKVTMLGRVMNCLEQVFVHDSFGHPIFFQTYSGKADIGNEALEMMKKIEDYLDYTSSNGKVNRVMIIDSAANAVSTLRNIANSDYFFVSILDDNQINSRKFKHIKRSIRYKYGNADLKDCTIELTDSKNKNYIYECRAIIIDWDKGKRTVLVSNLPIEAVDSSWIVKSYFDRWPLQELQFKSMKSVASIHRVMGYGKKKIPDKNMQKRQEEVKEKIDKLCRELKQPLVEIEKFEQKLPSLFKKERRLKEATAIRNGKRNGNSKILSTLKEYEKEINSIKHNIMEIKKPYKIKFDKLKKLKKEWKRIRGKTHVYKVDVELDQMITCFRISFVNLCAFFLSQIIKNKNMEISTVVNTFFMLNGSATETKDERIIKIKRNKKDPKMMKFLDKGLKTLNRFNIRNYRGKKYLFYIENY